MASSAAAKRESKDRKLYGGDPAGLPVYPLSEVAHFLWMPHRKLYRWSAGYTLDGKRQPAIIQIADRDRLLLSFNNLAELHILSALRNEEGSLQQAHLRRIDRDPNSGTVLRLFPFVKAVRSAEDALGQARLVAIDPRISFGRPVISGTCVPTTELSGRWSAGETIAELSEDFGLDARLVEDAIRYERADRRVA